VTHSQPQTSEQPVIQSSEAVRQFLVKAGELYGRQITAPLVAIWIDAVGSYPVETLAPLFRKVFATCKFFPTPAEVLEPLQALKEAALPEEANAAWQKVLAIRRTEYNPDLPQYLARALAKLPERVQRAARAAGVFREFESADDLHTWAKKAFLESYARWNELEESQFLLPEGELKNMLAEVAKAKAVPALPPSVENEL
jgi:hypothetical protein